MSPLARAGLLFLTAFACSRREPAPSGEPVASSVPSAPLEPLVLVSEAGAVGAPTAVVATETSATPEALPERYRKKPALVIIEAYALSVIGALSPDKEESARAIVKQTFGGGDDWRSTFRGKMAWPAGIDENIKTNWEGYQREAVKAGVRPDPRSFAHAFGEEFSKYRD